MANTNYWLDWLEAIALVKKIDTMFARDPFDGEATAASVPDLVETASARAPLRLFNPSSELVFAVKYGKDIEEYQARLRFPIETDLLFDDTDYPSNESTNVPVLSE